MACFDVNGQCRWTEVDNSGNVKSIFLQKGPMSSCGQRNCPIQIHLMSKGALVPFVMWTNAFKEIMMKNCPLLKVTYVKSSPNDRKSMLSVCFAETFPDSL